MQYTEVTAAAAITALEAQQVQAPNCAANMHLVHWHCQLHLTASFTSVQPRGAPHSQPCIALRHWSIAQHAPQVLKPAGVRAPSGVQRTPEAHVGGQVPAVIRPEADRHVGGLVR
jgi:hypothetical protein